MPREDGTGPSGMGPRTGRGLGSCGRDFSFRRGMGRGFRYAEMNLSKEEQRKTLEEEKKVIEEKLKELKDAKA